MKPGIGLTFADGLRSVLRQDPNVILVGEIRDLETAEIAIQASLTGHLVFSTLHTNDAASAITRLVDMGVEPFLVASSLVAVLAQRLVRVLCKDCRDRVRSHCGTSSGRSASSPPDRPDARSTSPSGCAGCNYSGYKGRVGIFELMLVDDSIRQMVSGQRRLQIDQEARRSKEACRALRSDGARKVLQGITSVAEVLRATEEEGVVAQI